ncbi:unnamed protein product [Cyprideis torosa]|uniref:Uncharacterized protein n=1 Tax=Cyprideis torosa TaxID=163714 RepID=A0A7R8ZH63_9CRUS|nr:unnamed protein product [Cyprideis torosa]CAG0881849.1 unnamed protein product [Cyprideis torosa]
MPVPAMTGSEEDFLQFLTLLTDNDNDVRAAAEARYAGIPLTQRVHRLFSVIRNTSVGDTLRTFAAVLLRRLFSTDWDDFFVNLPDDQKVAFRTEMLAALSDEGASQSMSAKLCELAAEMARNLVAEDGSSLWPELLKFLFDGVQSQSPRQRIVALTIFQKEPGLFGIQQANLLGHIKGMLAATLRDPVPEVQAAAAQATMDFIMSNSDEDSVLTALKDLSGPCLEVVERSCVAGDDDTLLKSLVDLVEDCAKWLRPQISPLFDMCIRVLSNENQEESWRSLALEVMVATSEGAPAMVRKLCREKVQVLVGLCLKLMATVDDDSSWETRDTSNEDDDEEDLSTTAEQAIDRLALALGGKVVLPTIANTVPQMLQSERWQDRHAALFCLSSCGEGCHKQMEPLLGQLIPNLVNFLRDPHPRVRYACCNALGQMATDFAPTFQKSFHTVIIPSLLTTIAQVSSKFPDDPATDSSPRVQAHAGAALVNMSEDCPRTLLTGHLDNIVSVLEQVMNAKFQELVATGRKLVLEQMITTLASVADTVEDKFIPYYEKFMPCLKVIFQNALKPEFKLLRGRTIECISLIGLAVGAEKFMSDAGEVMDLLLKAQVNSDQEEFTADDPQLSYMFSAWARICKILGKGFEPYLPMVMPPVMRTAQVKPDMAVLQEGEAKEMSPEWEIVSLDETQSIGIKTSCLEDKGTACQMLVCYASELKGAFAPYVQEVMAIMVPLLKFYFDDGVRTSAAESIAPLLEAAKEKGPAFVNEVWNYARQELLAAIDVEPDKEVLPDQIKALANCIEALNAPSCLDAESMERVVVIMEKCIQEHFTREEDRAKKQGDEDFDEETKEVLEEERDSDSFILARLSDLLHALFSVYRENFIQLFDRLAPELGKLLQPDRAWKERQWGLCFFDDVIEFTGPMCIKYQELIVPALAKYVHDPEPDVRQAAAYGIGLLAQHGGEQFFKAITDYLPLLVQVIESPGSKSPENVTMTENAISAVCRILQSENPLIDQATRDHLMRQWLSWLPVTEDGDEAIVIYGYLASLIEANNPVILGENSANLPRIVAILGEALSKEVLEAGTPVYQRLLMILKQVQNTPGVLNSCLQHLTEDQKTALAAALQS